MNLEDKIKDLFELRRLPLLVEGSGIDVGSKDYLGLIKLQKDIYYLDAYLESTWNLKEEKLQIYWKAIYNSLDKLRVSKADQAAYVSAIQKYQKHETQLRKGKLPIVYTLEYFYFYKSCDVKLLRRIIYDNVPSLSRKIPLADWRLFDLITELHDDIEDVYEDIDVYNGNCFLLNINARGLTATVDLFQDFINEIEWRLDEKFAKAKRSSKKALYELTKEAIMHLNILLQKRSEELNKKPIDNSKVIRKLSVGLTA